MKSKHIASFFKVERGWGQKKSTWKKDKKLLFLSACQTFLMLFSRNCVFKNLHPNKDKGNRIDIRSSILKNHSQCLISANVIFLNC